MRLSLSLISQHTFNPGPLLLVPGPRYSERDKYSTQDPIIIFGSLINGRGQTWLLGEEGRIHVGTSGGYRGGGGGGGGGVPEIGTPSPPPSKRIMKRSRSVSLFAYFSKVSKGWSDFRNTMYHKKYDAVPVVR